jgi:hypothetical protein
MGSKLKERRHRHDPFHQRAKKEVFAARADYKLHRGCNTPRARSAAARSWSGRADPRLSGSIARRSTS